jgi:SNF2 family DNA or RNA helicase
LIGITSQCYANYSAHRTGQKKPVSVTRIIVKNSVEERILALQEQKKTVSAAALGDEASGRIGKLSLKELVGLFGKVTTRNGEMTVE